MPRWTGAIVGAWVDVSADGQILGSGTPGNYSSGSESSSVESSRISWELLGIVVDTCWRFRGLLEVDLHVMQLGIP